MKKSYSNKSTLRAKKPKRRSTKTGKITMDDGDNNSLTDLLEDE